MGSVGAGKQSGGSTATSDEKMNVTLKSKDGSTQETSVSIQDMGSTIKAYPMTEVKTAKQLAQKAADNTVDANRPVFMQEVSATAEKWNKTNGVPIMANRGGQASIELTNGYASKLDNGDNVYIHKGRIDGWTVNYKGIAVNSYATLSEAKNGAKEFNETIKNNPRMAANASATFTALNKNGGKMDFRVYRQMNWESLADRLKR